MKIKVQPYNSAPTAQELQEYLDTQLSDCFIVANAQRRYWQNGVMTLVLRYKKSRAIGLDFLVGLRLGEMAWRFHVQEFDSTVENDITYYRLWWD